MITNDKTDKYALILIIVFITYLLLGSFVVSGNYLDLGYLVILYSVILVRILFYK